MTTDERNTYFWQKEREAKLMSEIARDIWKDKEKERAWLTESERCRREHYPKDRGYLPRYVTW